MFFWNAYRLDIAANDGTRVFAAGCIDNNPAGGCSFDHFVNYIQLGGAAVPTTTVGENITPDVITTARELANGQYVANYNATNLFAAGRFTSPRPALYDMLSAGVARILNVANTTSGSAVDNMTAGARTAMKGLHEQYLMEQVPQLVNLQSYFGYPPLLRNPARKTVDGTPYDSVDTIATEDQHPGFSQAYANFYQMIGNVNSTDPYWGKFASNNMAIQALQLLDSLMHAAALMKNAAKP